MRLLPTRTSLALCAISGALAAPAAAQGATASVDRACYPSDGSAIVTVTGSGYAPGEQVELQMAGGIIGFATADVMGNVRTTIPVPDPPTGGSSKNDKAYTVTLVQGTNSAGATFRSTRVLSDFSPSRGRPDRLKVRFSAWGFGVATAADEPMPKIYVHYVDSRRKVRRTVSLGAGSGPCGTIKRTKLRRLFPFNPRRGRWTLQFDTSRKYHRGTGVSRFVFDQIGLTVS